ISALAVVGALALAGCTDSSAPEGEETTAPQEEIEFEAGPPMAALNEAGAITIGTKVDQPPVGQVDADGNPQGRHGGDGQVIAAELGIPEDGITWTETVSANREPFIQSGEVDIVIATYTINDKRKEVISFAGPYYNAGQDILVLA